MGLPHHRNVQAVIVLRQTHLTRPFFVFAEYKLQRDPNGDPAGQALAAIRVGQQLNGHQHTVYGCYVIRRDWYFMVLDEQHYAISYGHNAIQSAELAEILWILKVLKEMIVELMQAD